MQTMQTMQTRFIRYEYKKIQVSSEDLALVLDAYASFGWQLDEKLSNLTDECFALLRLRRDKNLINRVELTRLQRNFEACMEQIEELRHNAKRTAAILSILIGLFGALLAIGSAAAFAFGHPVLGAALAMIAAVQMILPVFLYPTISKQRSKVIMPLIDRILDDIQALMEKGHALL